MLVIIAEVFLELANLHMLIKQNSLSLGSCEFWRIADSVLNKGKSVMSSLFDSPEVLSPASDKSKLLKTFPEL